MGFLSGILGGGSKSTSSAASNVTSEVNVGVTNTIDTTGLGEGISEGLSESARLANDSATKTFFASLFATQAQLESSNAALALQSDIAAVEVAQRGQLWDKIDKAGKLVALLGGVYFIFRMVK